MTPHQQRDLIHWRALGRTDDWARGWKDFHRGLRFESHSEEYRKAQVEAATLDAACRVTPKTPRPE